MSEQAYVVFASVHSHVQNRNAARGCGSGGKDASSWRPWRGRTFPPMCIPSLIAGRVCDKRRGWLTLGVTLGEAKLAHVTDAMCAPRGAGPCVNTKTAASTHTCTHSTVTESAHAES